MNLKELEKLIKLVEEANITQLKIEEYGVKIDIQKQSACAPTVVYAHPHPVAQPSATPTLAKVPEVAAATQTPAANELTINSPMVGTFYVSPSPDSPAFVTVGSKVRKGDTVCIIEAMKLFNEIEAEVDGTVTQILVKNEQSVEFGQALFVVKAD